MREYTDHPDARLRELLLQESYVLHVEATPGQLAISALFALTERHPDYAPPGPDDYLCYRRGVLVLSGVTSLEWRDQGAPPSRDATDELDHGSIDYLRYDGGQVELGGDVGQFVVDAAGMDVALVPDEPAVA